MRDLKADLELCEKATWGDWEALHSDTESQVVFTHIKDGKKLHGCICTVDGGCNHENDAQFIAAAREGWPEAIRRAMEAEAENKGLRERIAVSDHLISLLQEENTKLEGYLSEANNRIIDLESAIEAKQEPFVYPGC